MTASAQHGRGVARASAKQRHRCRNPKCRSKLPEPRASIHSAFCTKGCWQQFHRKRCVVCEKEFERTAEHQLVCGRRKCRAELKRQPEIYRPFHRGLYAQKLLPAPTPHAVPSAPSETLEKWASKPRIITGLRWARPDREDDDWELSGPDGRMVARIRQEGSGWWVARPRAIPEPPIEGRDEAMRRAERMAMWALPGRKRRVRESGSTSASAVRNTDDAPGRIGVLAIEDRAGGAPGLRLGKHRQRVTARPRIARTAVAATRPPRSGQTVSWGTPRKRCATGSEDRPSSDPVHGRTAHRALRSAPPGPAMNACERRTCPEPNATSVWRNFRD